MTTQEQKTLATKDFTDELAAMLPPNRARRARYEAEREILRIRLAELRKQAGLRQEDIPEFSQSAISKLEARNDFKLSTLLEYLDQLGLGIEIKVYPKNAVKTPQAETVLLKI